MDSFELEQVSSVESVKCKMSQSRKRRLEHIRYLHNYSSLPSRLTFYWFTALLRLGYRRPLEDEDLGELPDEEKTETQLTRLLDVYQTERVRNRNLGKLTKSI